MISEILSSGVLVCFPGFGVVRPGFSEFLTSEFLTSDFRSSRLSGAPDFGVPDVGAPDFGAPVFGVTGFRAPNFGVPNFGVPKFGIPQVTSSNFSTHEFDCSGGSGVGKHYKNSDFGIPEFRSFVFFLFRSCASQTFGVPDLGFSEFQVSEFQISEFQISEFQISEFQISEFRISEFQISELQVSEFLSSEFLVSEFLKSGAPTSQLTSLIVQEAVELADTTKTVVSEFLGSGVLAFLASELRVLIFGVPSASNPP